MNIFKTRVMDKIALNEIWTSLYDKGINFGLESFSLVQRHLYYYIDFTIYVYNGGASGFIYNKSPATLEEYEYQPYIEGRRFFNYNHLSDLIEKALEQYTIDETQDFRVLYDKFGLKELEEEAGLEINKVMKDDEYVWDWTDKNQELLRDGL